jgi:hypothetical protein
LEYGYCNEATESLPLNANSDTPKPQGKRLPREIHDKTSLKILAETNLKIEIALQKSARNC